MPAGEKCELIEVCCVLEALPRILQLLLNDNTRR